MYIWGVSQAQMIRHLYRVSLKNFMSSVSVFVQSLSCVWVFVSPSTTARQSSLSFAVSWTLLRLMSLESVMPSSHLILRCHLLFMLSIFLSTGGFSSESALCIRWPKYWSFSFSISPSSEYSELVSFRTDLLIIQGTLKRLLQHHSSKASVLQS